MGRYTLTEREATIQEETNRYMNSLPERRAQEKYEPYWLYCERQRPYSEFNEEYLSNYMWHKWGIK